MSAFQIAWLAAVTVLVIMLIVDGALTKRRLRRLSNDVVRVTTASSRAVDTLSGSAARLRARVQTLEDGGADD